MFQEGQLQCEGFEKDRAYWFDQPANSGQTQRIDWTKGSNIHELEGILHVDLAQQDRAIVNGVEVGVKLYQANDEFRLFSGEREEIPPPVGSGDPPTYNPITNYRLNIVDATLKVCFLQLNPSVVLAHNRSFKISPMIYPYWKSVVKSFGIPKGNFNFTIDDLFNGYCPTRLVVGFVSSAAYSGSMTRNPFNFDHYFLNFLEFSVDGVSVPSAPLTPNYTIDETSSNGTQPYEMYKNGYTTEYKRLFGNKYPQSDGNFINLGKFVFRSVL